MNVLDDYTQQVLKTLIKNKVKFLVIGGYAVNYYGYKRTTGDIDLWVKPTNDINKENFILSLKELGIKKTVLDKINNLNFEIAQVFQDGIEPFRIDFVTLISGVKFNNAWEKKINVKLDNIIIPFISYKDLIISKITSERLKDKLDVEELQKIKKK